MFGIFSRVGIDELTLVFDIGSSSVGGAVFRMHPSGVPEILFSVREPVLLEVEVDSGKFLKEVSKALDVVSAKASKAGLGAPHRIFAVLSSPWYISQTRIIKQSKEIPFTFTSVIADDMIKKEINNFEAEHFTKYINSESAIRSIELKNIRIALNGYETPKPLDRETKEVEMTIFFSLSSEAVLQEFEKSIAKHFSHKNVKFCSFGLASFTVVRDLYAEKEDFLLVDIGGEVTDIAMVKKNVLRESISFPFGRNFMIRGAAAGLDCSLSEAESCISLFKDGHAALPTKKKVGSVVDKLKADWLLKFQESLANLSGDISIPATIYMAVDEDFSEFFEQTIKTEQFSQYTLTQSKFEVKFLDTKLFHGMAQFKDEVIRDPFIIIDSIYINRFLTK